MSGEIVGLHPDMALTPQQITPGGITMADPRAEAQAWTEKWERAMQYAENLAVRAGAAEARIAELEVALRREWESNHYEHCTNMKDCDTFKAGGIECCWPLPDVLKGIENDV